MKRIFMLSIVLLMLTSSACNIEKSPEQESIAESTIEPISETTAVETTEIATEKVTETEAVTEIVQDETIQITSMPKAEKLNLGEVDEKNGKEYPEFIYFTDYGRYYFVEIGGRNSANMVLCLDRYDRSPMIFAETEDSNVIYCDENALYINKSLVKQGKLDEYILYKLENEKFTVIDEPPFECGKKIMGDYFYYIDKNIIYQMNKDKEKTATIKLPEKARDYAVYDNKIWYDWRDDIHGYGLSFYDLETGETKNFDEGRIGIINNGYMYYNESDKIIRVNLSNCEYEIVCEAENGQSVSAFNFYDNFILYAAGEELYRLSDNENTFIFSTKDFFDDLGYDVRDIQCQDDRIFLRIGSGGFYECLMEIDIDGNIIEVIHEGRYKK